MPQLHETLRKQTEPYEAGCPERPLHGTAGLRNGGGGSFVPPRVQPARLPPFPARDAKALTDRGGGCHVPVSTARRAGGGGRGGGPAQRQRPSRLSRAGAGSKLKAGGLLVGHRVSLKRVAVLRAHPETVCGVRGRQTPGLSPLRFSSGCEFCGTR